MKKLKLLNKLLILLLIFSPICSALEVKGLYEVEVLARSRSAEDRKAAIEEALKIVMGRIVAADNVLQQAVVKKAIADASHYVRQFQFSLTAAASQTDKRARLLRVVFDEQQLLNLLRNSNVGIWSEIRPETLIWLVVERHGIRHLFIPETMPEVDNAFSQAAQLKGLPVIYPLLDLEEQQQISVNDVLSADSTILLSMSKRYEVVSVMAGRLVDKGHCWQAEWALYFDNQIKQSVSSCDSMNNVALSAMQGAYDVLSRYYGVKPENSLQKIFIRKGEPL